MFCFVLGLLGGLSIGLAQDSEPPWYVGRTVAYVSLESTAGNLPEDDLLPLMQVALGESFSAGAVRHDIEVLMRAGQFASVEAHAEPWPLSETELGVWVQFRIVSPPRIRRVNIQGSRGLPRQIVREALSLTRGAPFFVDEQSPVIEAELRALLEDAGWPEARVVLSTRPVDNGVVDLNVDLESGDVRRYQEVNLVGDTGLPEQVLLRRLRRAGVGEGQRVDRRQLVAARDELRDLLSDGRNLPFSTPRRWLNARVRFAHDLRPDGDILTIFVEAGSGVEINSRGRGAPRSTAAAEALQLYTGDRVETHSEEELERALVEWFAVDGHRNPMVSVRMTETDWGHRIDVNANRGALHRLRRVSVNGAREYTEAYLGSVFREGAPDSLQQRFVTDEGIQQAIRGLEEFYRGQGFLDAEVSLAAENIGTPKWWRPRLLVDVSLVVDVAAGERTWLRSLEVLGGRGLETQRIADAQRELVGMSEDDSQRRPLSRARLDALRQEVVEAYRAAGYLNADARLEIIKQTDDSGAQVADVVMVIAPGEKLILRGVIVQGNLRTRREVILRELVIETGQPITPDALQQSRRQLYDLGLFRVVNPELLGDEPQVRDLIVHLEERPNLLLEGGAGVSTDQGIRATGRAVHRNLGGRGWRLTALGQIGYGWIADSFVPAYDEPIWTSALRYEANGFPQRGQRIIVEGLLNETSQEPAFRVSRRGVSVGLQFATLDGLEALLDYRVQWRQLEDVDPGVLLPQDPWFALFDDPQNPQLPSAWRYQGGPSVQLLYDQRDNRLNPTKGGYTLGRAELSDALGSGLLFVRLSSRGETLMTVGGSTLRIGYQAGLGMGSAGTTLPLEDRFFLGGTDSLRGFALNTVGPANLSARPELDYPSQIDALIDATALRQQPSLWVYTGGDTLVAGSVESRTPLSQLGLPGWDSTQLVLFCDVGQVWFRDTSVDTTLAALTAEGARVRVGTGLGIRMATPIGPAALELGINPARVPAREEPRFVPHISLGAL